MKSRMPWVLYSVALAAFASSIVVGLVGNATIGAVAACASFIVASVAFLLRRLDALESNLLTVDPVLAQFAAKVGSNSVEAFLLRGAAATYHERLSEIAQGRVSIGHKAELFAAMCAIAGSAKHTIHAVDQIPLDDWESQPLKDLLKVQGGKRNVDMIRVRIVEDDKLEEDDYLRKLGGYVEAQRRANVRVRLCRRSLLKQPRLHSVQPGGWMLADRDDPSRTKGTYSIVVGDSLTDAAIYLQPNRETRARGEEFDAVYNASEAETEAVLELLRKRASRRDSPAATLTDALTRSLQAATTGRRRTPVPGTRR